MHDRPRICRHVRDAGDRRIAQAFPSMRSAPLGKACPSADRRILRPDNAPWPRRMRFSSCDVRISSSRRRRSRAPMPPRRTITLGGKLLETCLKRFDVFASFGQHQGGAPVFQGFGNPFVNQRIALFIAGQFRVDRRHGRALCIVDERREDERRFVQAHDVLEASSRGLGFWIDAVANRTALHEDDRMVPVFAGDGCG